MAVVSRDKKDLGGLSRCVERTSPRQVLCREEAKGQTPVRSSNRFGETEAGELNAGVVKKNGECGGHSRSSGTCTCTLCGTTNQEVAVKSKVETT